MYTYTINVFYFIILCLMMTELFICKRWILSKWKLVFDNKTICFINFTLTFVFLSWISSWNALSHVKHSNHKIKILAAGQMRVISLNILFSALQWTFIYKWIFIIHRKFKWCKLNSFKINFHLRSAKFVVLPFHRQISRAYINVSWE